MSTEQKPPMTISMQADSECLPAGVFVRSVGAIKTLSFWAGDHEFVTELSQAQAANLARALTESAAVYQVCGRARLFTPGPNGLKR